MQKPLSLATLGDLDSGTAAVIIDCALAEAIRDVEDRGADGKARKVTIEVTLMRRSDGLIETDVGAQAKLPPRRTNSTVGKPVVRGHKTELLFQQWAPDQPDQSTIPGMDHE